MVKTAAAKTNGHSIATLKPAPKALAATAVAKKATATPATARARAKPAPNAAARPAAKAVAKPVAKAAAKPAAKPAAKRATKAAPAPIAKPAAKRAAKAPTKVPAAKPAAPDPAETVREKARKTKLVRDSFTMPEQEYALLGQVKKACLKAGFEIKKSELLRIGVALISQIDMATLQNVLASLPQLKTGRPKNA